MRDRSARGIVIPDPSLVVLVGPAGAGKSTFAARHFKSDEILSSDTLRAVIAGNEADQRATKAAFSALHRRLRTRLLARRLTVVDATNVERGARRLLVARARAAGLPAIAVVFDLPPDVVRAQNANRRGRVVDPAVVDRHIGHLRRSLDRPGLALLDEGFSAVIVFRDPTEIGAVSVRRVPS
jgi:predicted kinase